MNLVERVKNILMQPKSEWQVIEREPGDVGTLFPNYVMILAAIPVVCSFIRGVVIGYGPFHIGVLSGLLHAIVTYLLMLVGVFVVAYVIDLLAGTFGGRQNFANALKVSAYAATPGLLVGIFDLIPFLGILKILGLYGLYLLYTGILALMKPAADKAIIYTIAVIVCLVVFYLVVAVVLGTLFGVGMMGIAGRY
ncbi:MAG TPA: Yip1 family protein [Pseudolabrys sp.]|nr:Yip1 family protein [Pseudolabrys sp.]